MTWRERLGRLRFWWRRAADQTPPESAWAERLEQAIAAARPRCLECGNGRVTVEYRPALGDWIPVSHHWAGADPAGSCPVLAGGAAAWHAHEDLWAALDPYLFVADYGEATWARRQLAGTP